MAFHFNAFQPLQNTSTLITFQDADTPEHQVQISGSGLNYNPQTGLLTGAITAFSIVNTNTSATVQTLTPGAPSAVLTSLSLFLTQSAELSDLIGVWEPAFANVANPVFSGTEATVEIRNNADVLIGFIRINGSGLTDANFENGLMTSVTHLDALGQPVPGNVKTYPGSGILAGHFSYGLLHLAGGTSGNPEVINSQLNTGNDTLTAGPGAAVVALDGGAGNDTYIVDGYTIEITDTGGTDTLVSAITRNLALDPGISTANIEKLTLTGGVDANGFGNGLNNTIIGNTAVNVLEGANGNDALYGGDGADVVKGEIGSDHLYGGTGGDQHLGGDGFDYARYDDANYGTVRVSLTNPGVGTGAAAGDTFFEVEGVIGGAGGDVIYGSEVYNILEGRGGNDTLFGGLDADSLRGGDGVDYARYDDANYGNLVLSLANAAQNSGTGAAGDVYNSIEGLMGGGGNDRIGGNGYINYLYGLGGDDIIAGNAGNDTLSGGAGLDTFVFNTPLDAAINRDTILDFVAADDTIQLDRSFFSNTLPLGTLSADRFNTGAAASDASDRIIYNQATGAVMFDADGSGTAFTAVQFATLSTKPTITNADFFILA